MHGLSALPRRRPSPSVSGHQGHWLGSAAADNVARSASRPERFLVFGAFALCFMAVYCIVLPHPSARRAFGPRDLAGLDDAIAASSHQNTNTGSRKIGLTGSRSSSTSNSSNSIVGADDGSAISSLKHQAQKAVSRKATATNLPLLETALAAKSNSSIADVHDVTAAAAAAAAAAASNATSDAQDASRLNSAAVQALLAEQTPLNWPKVDNVDPAKYLVGKVESEDLDMDTVRQRLVDHIKSDAYQARLADVRRRNKRGIVVNAGGSLFIANLIVLLKVLREVHHSQMEVEVFWQSAREMDNTTLANLQRQFGPLRGADITALPHPVPGLHKADADLFRFTGKVYSLLHTSFSEVIMIDADCIPAQPPEVFFSHPQYNGTGSLFWPDAWTGAVNSQVFRDAGVDPQGAREALAQGRGWSRRDTESGQLVLDLRQHLDVIEYVFWMNSFRNVIGTYMWGDKDSFAIAFAAAGKAHMFSQVAVPPAGLFAWRPAMLFHKVTEQVSPGWQLLGFLQHDSWGRPAFVHRTINKFNIDQKPWAVELITPPLPKRWIDYYLAHDNLGPTKGVPWNYVVPASAFAMMALNVPPTRVFADRKGWLKVHIRGCPYVTFLDYWTIRESGLPLDKDAELEARCMMFLKGLMGEEVYEEYGRKGYLTFPNLRFQSARYMEDIIYTRDGYSKEPENTPIPAWRPDEFVGLQGPFASMMRASYQAYDWMIGQEDAFPILLADRRAAEAAAHHPPAPPAPPATASGY